MTPTEFVKVLVAVSEIRSVLACLVARVERLEGLYGLGPEEVPC